MTTILEQCTRQCRSTDGRHRCPTNPFLLSGKRLNRLRRGCHHTLVVLSNLMPVIYAKLASILAASWSILPCHILWCFCQSCRGNHGFSRQDRPNPPRHSTTTLNDDRGEADQPSAEWLLSISAGSSGRRRRYRCIARPHAA